MDPSAARLWKRARSGPKRQREAMASTTRKPMLCRLPAYFGPGFPRPARISMLVSGYGNGPAGGPGEAVATAVGAGASALRRLAFASLAFGGFHATAGDGGDHEVAVRDG